MHFSYKPLPEGDGEWIRALRLFPGKGEDPIVCELLLMNLRRSHFRKTPKYEAVSYVWGDLNRVQEITCEGLPLFITINLYQALRRFRYHDQSRELWADGICIDQQNDVEKEYQVSIMGQIYEQSNCTLIWLGEVDHFPCEDRHPSCAEDAISLIRDFNCYFESQYAKLDNSSLTDVVRDIHKIPPVPGDHRLRNQTKKWGCLRALLSRPWFSRVWVLQEVGLSPRAIAFSGKSSFPFSDLVLFVLVYDSTAIVPKSDSLPTGRIMDAFWSIWSTFGMNESWMNEKSAVKEYAHEMKRRYGTDSNAAILILGAGRQFEASEDRDHIYAFLGHPALRGILKPDYGAALEHVCLALAQKLLCSGCSLNMLTFVDNSDDDLLRSDSSPPSWVPQWHTSLTYRRYPHERWMLREINTTAHETIINVSGNRLHIAALLVDTVDGCTQTLGGPLGDTGAAATDSHLGHKVQQLWNTFCDSRQNSGVRAVRISNCLYAFIWTLVYGRYPHPPLVEADFDSFCKHYGVSNFSQSFGNDISRRNSGPTLVSSIRFRQAMDATFHNKRFFTTTGGRCGIGPQTIRDGDIVALVFGCNAPLILRPTSTPDHYKLSGSSFIFDLIYNATMTMDQWRNGLLQKQEIVLE